MTRNFISFLVFLSIFLSIFYYKSPYQFGYGNNIEELPLIYYKIGIAEYPNDPFVTKHTERFTAVTPYVSILSFLSILLNIKSLYFTFFLINFLSIIGLYLSISIIYHSISKPPPFLLFIFILGLLYVTNTFWIIPNGRWLFRSFADPELLAYPLILFTIAFYLLEKKILTILLLFFSTLIHPLYTIFFYCSLCGCEIYRYTLKDSCFSDIFKKISLFTLAVLPYVLFLYINSKQNYILSNIDASKISEFIRSPHHHSIPNLLDLPRRFYLFSIGSLLISLFILKFDNISIAYQKMISHFLKILNLIKLEHFSTIIKNRIIYEEYEFIQNELLNKKFKYLIFIQLFLIIILFTTSILSTFFRISLLVQLTPYRIGVIIVVLSWILITASLYSIIIKPNFYFKKNQQIFLNFIRLLIFCLAMTFIYSLNKDNTKTLLFEQRELISWIKEETNAQDMFLNYSDIPIRTQCLRSSFFEFKTFPLTDSLQIDWYNRFQAFYDVPENIGFDKDYKADIDNFKAVKKYVDKLKEVDANAVLKRINVTPKYLIKCNQAIPQEKQLKHFHKNILVNTLNYKCVYKNNLYSIYEL